MEYIAITVALIGWAFMLFITVRDKSLSPGTKLALLAINGFIWFGMIGYITGCMYAGYSLAFEGFPNFGWHWVK